MRQGLINVIVAAIFVKGFYVFGAVVLYSFVPDQKAVTVRILREIVGKRDEEIIENKKR